MQDPTDSADEILREGIYIVQVVCIYQITRSI